MDFLDIYQLVENRQYDRFSSTYNQYEDELTDYQNIILQISHANKLGDFKESEILINEYLIKNQNNDVWEEVSIQVKLLAFLPLIGESGRSKQIIEQLNNFYQDNEPETEFDMMIKSDFYSYCASFYTLQGKKKTAIRNFQQSLDIEIIMDNPLRKAKIQSNYGIAKFYLEGNLTESLSLLFEAKKIQEEYEDWHSAAISYGNISEVFELKGDYQLSLEYIKQAQSIFESFNNPEELAMNLFNQARIVSKLSDFNTSDTLYQQSLEIRRAHSDTVFPIYYAQTLTSYLIFLLNNGKSYESIYNELVKLCNKCQNSVIIQQRLEFAKIVIQYHSREISDKITAVGEIQELADTSINDFPLYNEVVHYLIDALLLEYRIMRKPSSLITIQEYAKIIKKLASEQGSLELLVKEMIIQFQTCIYQDKIEEAYVIINDLMELASKKGLPHLSRTIDLIFRRFQNLLSSTISDIASQDIVTSISNFLQAQPESIEDSIKIISIGLVSINYDYTDLCGSLPPDIELRNYINYICLDTRQFIWYFDQYSLLILKDLDPWIAVVFTGNSKDAITIIYCLNDYLNMEYSLLDTDLNKLEFLKSERMKRQIKKFIQMDFKPQQEFYERKYPDRPYVDTMTLTDFDMFLHPIRLSIMHNLKSHFKLLRTELRSYVGGKKSTFTLNLNKLLEEGFVRSETHFIDDRHRKLIFITKKGLDEFKKFRDIF